MEVFLYVNLIWKRLHAWEEPLRGGAKTDRNGADADNGKSEVHVRIRLRPWSAVNRESPATA